MKKSYVVGFILFQIALLGTMIGRYSYVLSTGTPIKVEVRAVDPNDVFRGQYVALDYPIATWTGGLSTDFSLGSRVYLSVQTSASGVIDRVLQVYQTRAECPKVCIGAKITGHEIHTDMLVKYTHLSATGTLVTKPSEEFTQVDYMYANNYSPQIYTAGDKVQIYNAYSLDQIGGLSKWQNPADTVGTNTNPSYSQKPGEVPMPNGEILKIIRTDHVMRFAFDASRFYVREGTGYSVEQLIRDSKVYANLRVGKDGTTVLESLDANGTILR